MASLLAELLDVVLAVDAAVVQFVTAARTPLLTKVMTSVTGLGSASAALVFLGVFYLAEWDTELAEAGVALATSGVVVGTLMQTVQRAFPPDPVCMTGGAETVAHSFPSGHAAAVVVFAMVSRDSDALPFWAIAPVAVVIAASRIYLGTHYFSDTVFGMALGVVTVLFARRVVEQYDVHERIPTR